MAVGTVWVGLYWRKDAAPPQLAASALFSQQRQILNNKWNIPPPGSCIILGNFDLQLRWGPKKTKLALLLLSKMKMALLLLPKMQIALLLLPKMKPVLLLLPRWRWPLCCSPRWRWPFCCYPRWKWTSCCCPRRRWPSSSTFCRPTWSWSTYSCCCQRWCCSSGWRPRWRQMDWAKFASCQHLSFTSTPFLKKNIWLNFEFEFKFKIPAFLQKKSHAPGTFLQLKIKIWISRTQISNHGAPGMAQKKPSPAPGTFLH